MVRNIPHSIVRSCPRASQVESRDAEAIDDPSAIRELENHRIAATEMVLRVHRADAADFKARIFGHRAAANRDQAS